jgi:hypothetical protein
MIHNRYTVFLFRSLNSILPHLLPRNQFWVALLVLLGTFVSKSYAQPVNNYTKGTMVHAPNAAALAKYGEVPVSYVTGVPNISVPIHTLTEGPLSLSISLNYHAGGIRLSENASWVGQGWSLFAGGTITRTVQGIADEVPGKGYYSTGHTINSMTWSHFSAHKIPLTLHKDGKKDIKKAASKV